MIKKNKRKKQAQSWPVTLLMVTLFVALILSVLILSAYNFVSADVSVVLLTGIIGAISWIVKSDYDKRREYERLSYETRRKAYDEILEPFIDMFKAVKRKEQAKILPGLVDKMIESGTRLMLYGSDDVCHAFNNFKLLGQKTDKPDPYKVLVVYGRLLHAMRKDVGFAETDVTIEDILCSFIIDYEQHKEDFRKYI